jgi:hypothetical protein
VVARRVRAKTREQPHERHFVLSPNLTSLFYINSFSTLVSINYNLVTFAQIKGNRTRVLRFLSTIIYDILNLHKSGHDPLQQAEDI